MLYFLDPGMKLKVCVLCSKFSCLFQTSYQKQPCEKVDEYGQNLTTKYKLIILVLDYRMETLWIPL